MLDSCKIWYLGRPSLSPAFELLLSPGDMKPCAALRKNVGLALRQPRLGYYSCLPVSRLSVQKGLCALLPPSAGQVVSLVVVVNSGRSP